MSFNKDTGMYEGYIYLITNKVNGKGYIGQTNRTVPFRFQQHQYRSTKAKYTQPLYNAFKKYGIDNFDVQEILKISSKTLDELTVELNSKEEAYIIDYNTKTPNGYNVLSGGAENPTILTSKMVYQFDDNGVLVNTFTSISKASNYLGFATYHYTLVKYMDSYIKYKGYYWMSVDKFDPNKIVQPKQIIKIIEKPKEKIKKEKPIPKITEKKQKSIKPPKEMKEKKERPKRPVYQYDNHFNLIKFYDDYRMVDESIISHSFLGKIFKHGAIYSKGYIWSPLEVNSEMCHIVRNYKLPFYQFELDGTYVGEWDCISEATRKYSNGNNHSSIKNVLEGRMSQAFGYLWSYSKTPPVYESRVDKFGIKVRQLSMNREFINDYDSLADAQRATNIPYQSISAVCNGKYSQAGGYIWEYAS